MNNPIWITVETVIGIHRRQLAEHGGQDGVRDAGLLDSAINRPQQMFAYSDPAPPITTLAASYAYGIARNHAFIDGNKRTAYVVCRTFLLINGFDLTATSADRYTQFLGLAAGDVTEVELADWLAANTAKAVAE